jgi:hypothetical protein
MATDVSMQRPQQPLTNEAERVRQRALERKCREEG